MVRRIIFRFFWNTYDSLGAWLLAGTLAFMLCLPLLTAPAAWGGLLGLAARCEREESIGLQAYWVDFRRLAWRSTAMGAILLAVEALVVFNLGFYANAALSGALPPLLRLGLMVLFFWIGVFGFMAVQVGWAFLALQDLPVGRALKRGFLVTGAHFFAALLALVIGAAAAVALGLSVLGAFVLLPALLANLAMGLAGGAVEHYEAFEDARRRRQLEAEDRKSWGELRELDEREAARRRRYDRGFRDIIRPWDMK
ncbi:MAG: hypothetical protein M1457_08770 [bacterium]|nr:hypothetical protein [bacterium]